MIKWRRCCLEGRRQGSTHPLQIVKAVCCCQSGLLSSLSAWMLLAGWQEGVRAVWSTAATGISVTCSISENGPVEQKQSVCMWLSRKLAIKGSLKWTSKTVEWKINHLLKVRKLGHRPVSKHTGYSVYKQVPFLLIH